MTRKIYYEIPQLKGIEGVSVRFMHNRVSPVAGSLNLNDLFYDSDTMGNAWHIRLADTVRPKSNLLKEKVLNTVNIKKTIKTPLQIMDEKYTSGFFRKDNAVRFDLANDPSAPAHLNILDYLQGKVAGLKINTAVFPTSIYWRTQPTLLFLDEIPTDVDRISDVPVSDVAYVSNAPGFFRSHRRRRRRSDFCIYQPWR